MRSFGAPAGPVLPSLHWHGQFHLFRRRAAELSERNLGLQQRNPVRHAPAERISLVSNGTGMHGQRLGLRLPPTGCTNPDPIIIDTRDEGFHLTDVAHGVRFRFVPGQPPIQMAWTDGAFGNGFLVLDRNGNGIIDDGTELFGGLTPQPPTATPNGYLALAVFDRPEFGGNGDGFIDAHDAVYDRLRVWVDANHNGISEPGELHTLRELGIVRIDLKYRFSRYVDRFGNEFRYRARIWDRAARDRFGCYDVFLLSPGR